MIAGCEDLRESNDSGQLHCYQDDTGRTHFEKHVRLDTDMLFGKMRDRSLKNHLVSANNREMNFQHFAIVAAAPQFSRVPQSSTSSRSHRTITLAAGADSLFTISSTDSPRHITMHYFQCWTGLPLSVGIQKRLRNVSPVSLRAFRRF